MADYYQDIEEMSRYARHSISALEGITTLDPLVGRLRDDQSALLVELEAALSQRQSSASTRAQRVKDQREASEATQSTLSALFTTLESAEANGSVFDFKAFFPTRRRKDIGLSIADRLASVRRCLTALQLYPSVPGAKEWTEKLTELEARFSQSIDTASSSSQKSTEDIRVFQSLRQQWRRRYLACKRGVEAVLLLSNRENELKSFFLDLK